MGGAESLDLVDENGDFSEFAEVEALGPVWNDGKKIKEDTYYTLKNGEFVEVEG